MTLSVALSSTSTRCLSTQYQDLAFRADLGSRVGALGVCLRWLFRLAWMIALGLPTRASAGAFPYPVTSTTLPNGVAVVVVPMPSPGVVAFGTWMSVGSRDELDPGRTGFAHFFEHLMFLGTPSVSGDAREAALLRLGAADNAWTWLDETVYHVLIPREGLEELVRLEADRFQHLQLTPDQVRREAGAVYGEYRKGLADPGERLSDRLHEVAFASHTYHHSTIGVEGDIAAMPEAHAYAESFFARHYRPDRATVLVVGDVDVEESLRLVTEAYGAWKPATSAARAQPPVEPPQTAIRRAKVEGEFASARVAFGWKIPGADPHNADVEALALLETLLLSRTGSLYRRLVLDEALAQTVDGGREDFVDPCLFVIQVEMKEGVSAAQVETIVREEVAKVQATVDAAALERARTHERYAFLSSLDEPMAVLMALGSAMRRGGPDAVDAWFERFDLVTPDDVAVAARRYFVDAGLTVITLGGEE
jgi:zinc protease